MTIGIGITGASGSLYARRLISILKDVPSTTIRCMFSDTGKRVFEFETDTPYESIAEKNVRIDDNSDLSTPYVSGSSVLDAMVIVPCSMNTLARIASGISGTLMTRAADVVLKERRRLILAVRESPYSLTHIRNMEAITLAGGIILPASPGYYLKPDTIEELADTVVYRIIDQLGITIPHPRYGEM
ncbi:MAG: UbiX family flavin prenyltransferase [Spirochaetota bacterium]